MVDLSTLKTGLYFFEFGGGADLQMHPVKRVIVSENTPYQKVDIVEISNLGVCLFLDHRLQSAQVDEFVYHEAIVHPAMVRHPGPESVFIIGGGEGATLREVLRHSSVKRVTMCDIDQGVVELAKTYLPDWHCGAFDDPRVSLVHDDARAHLEADRSRYDAIIMDLSEPLAGSPARLLFTREFFSIIRSRMTENGVFCLQSGCGSIGHLDLCATVRNTLKTTFTHCSPFQVQVPSFYTLWSFTFASDIGLPTDLTAEEIDARLKMRGVSGLRSYDGPYNAGLFSLPRYFREEINAHRSISTDERPFEINEQERSYPDERR